MEMDCVGAVRVGGASYSCESLSPISNNISSKLSPCSPIIASAIKCDPGNYLLKHLILSHHQ